MRPLLIDTNVYVGFMRGDQALVQVMRYAERIYLNSIVLGELLAGFTVGSREAQNRAELSQFLNSPRVDVLPISAETAGCYALIYAALRTKGKPIPADVLWIAASALEYGTGLVSLDAHFGQVDGLHCGQRLEDFLP
ncbi:MAG: type II toxin-antitoxin system VapC family toxin [Gammaproteobacteria bacterium SHHR-1]|uniref:type II toxin-antitoxin system VapC family toxin n=1 Tax=Magnetovirga frankeli TaxID=947516 RepID=UPI00129328B5|nr:type II toxin-antitoxin system VapC family toxin [gamma proteobacterium SS-5]